MAKLFKEGQNRIQDLGRLIIASTPEMVDSVNALILVDRRFTIENISEQLLIFMNTAHVIVHDELGFSGVSFCWFPKLLTPEHKENGFLLPHLWGGLRKENYVVKHRFSNNEPELKRQSMEWKYIDSRVKESLRNSTQ